MYSDPSAPAGAAAALSPREARESGRGAALAVGLLLGPFVLAGYLALTVVLLVPVLGARRLFPRRRGLAPVARAVGPALGWRAVGP
jgi:hypothetical protein